MGLQAIQSKNNNNNNKKSLNIKTFQTKIKNVFKIINLLNTRFMNLCPII